MTTPTTITLNPGVGGDKTLVDSALGTLDGAAPPTGALAQIVELAAVNAGFAPGYSGPEAAGITRLNVDPDGAAIVRGAVLTDEGTFRLNFANTSLAVAIGSVTVSGAVVTGTGFLTADTHKGDYFKVAADADTAYVQVESIDSDTQATLVGTYTGTASGTGNRVLMKPVIGTGGSIAVASGQATIGSGTTIAAKTGIERVLDYAPLVYRARFSLSQRIVNQAWLPGLRENAATPRWFARFRFDGTVNTTAICETGRNPTGAPSASETESTTFTIPDGLTSAALLDVRIEELTESVRFYVGGILVAEHNKVIPHQHDEMVAVAEWVNAGSAPASNTNAVLDYCTGKNHNKVEVGVFSDTEQIAVSNVQAAVRAYNVAGVIAINTDLMIIDCRRARTVNLQAVSIGTTGRLDFFLTNDLTQIGTAQPGYPIGGGAGVTTSTAAGMWNIPTNGAAFLRVRLGVATTAGTTTLAASVSQTAHPLPGQTTQPVSGTVTANQGTMVALPAGAANIGYVGPQIPLLVADVASAALTTTTTTAAFTPAFGSSYSVNIPVTAVTGTTPTMDVVIEESDDTGTNWTAVYAFPRITATGMYRSPPLPNLGNRVRYAQTVTGTTPSFTRAVNRLQRSDSVLPLRQSIDRTVSLTTLNSATPTLNSQGTRNVQLVLNVGAITTTAPALQLEGSDDNGGTWYAIGSPLTAVASSTVQVLVNNLQAGALRARVSTAGVGVTAGYTLLKAF